MTEEQRLTITDIMSMLREVFPVEYLSWLPISTNKDKTKGLAAAYVTPRAYEDRLNQVCPTWHCEFKPWGENQLICTITIQGADGYAVRSSTGEEDSSNKNTAVNAEAQAFKRACVKFGLGAYLYRIPTQWADINKYKQFTPATQKALSKKAMAIITGKEAGTYSSPPPVPDALPLAKSAKKALKPKPVKEPDINLDDDNPFKDDDDADFDEAIREQENAPKASETPLPAPSGDTCSEGQAKFLYVLCKKNQIDPKAYCEEVGYNDFRQFSWQDAKKHIDSLKASCGME